MRTQFNITEISKRLASDIERVCTHLLPAGKRCGRFYEVGSVDGETGKTLKVNLEGDRRGRWVDWNGQDHRGDALDLWAATRRLAMPEALREAKAWLGIREPTLPEKTYPKPQDTMPPLSADGKAMHWLVTVRKLEAAIVNRFRIQGCAEKKAVVFPCYSPTGHLVNRSYRTLDEEKRVWQDKGAAPCLFGWHALPDEAYLSREVLICEGQIDAMTWSQWGIPALSIPNGSGMTWLEYEWANLEAFRTIYLAFDSDPAGDKNRDEVAARLGKHRTRVVRIPHKDANEALKRGETAITAREWVNKSEFASVAHLVDAGHFIGDTIEQFFPTLDRRGHAVPQTTSSNDEVTFRFRPAELTLWTGTSGHGKSTLLNNAMLLLASKTKRPSLIVSLEMNPAKVLRRMILSTGVAIATADDVELIIDATLKHWILFCDKVGKITRDELFELLNYAFARYGIAHACVDSLMRIKGLEEDYPAQNEFVTDLATFTRETGVHVHVVAHPRKQTGHNAPEAHDIKGSGHLRDNADNVLVVWRNREKEKLREAKDSAADNMPDAKIIVEKDREEGMYRDFSLTFNPHTYNYTIWQPPVNETPKNVTRFRR